MSRERRYTDDEVRAIFGAASDDPPGDDGGEAREADIDRRGSDLTLVQLRDIAAEVGLDPERVASAALALDQADAARGRVPAVDRARRIWQSSRQTQNSHRQDEPVRSTCDGQA
jgi:hypothetical protein